MHCIMLYSYKYVFWTYMAAILDFMRGSASNILISIPVVIYLEIIIVEHEIIDLMNIEMRLWQ